MPGAERTRVEGFGKLEDGLREASPWYLWGPYVSERQWGTVREDYSADGQAWTYFPHDHARSRAYRWGEDGMAGFSDVEQRLCLALALWNGRDPILKERMFGLTGAQANHGEDVKEYWWYLDAVPSHAWNRWRYHYPQRPYPYDDLIAVNGRRSRLEPEYELLDTGAFDDDRYWIVEVDYVKADPTDLLMTVRVTNAGPERRHAPRASHRVVPQHLVLGARRAQARAVGRRRRRRGHRSSVPRRPGAAGRPRPGRGPTRRSCSARTRRTPAASTAPPVRPTPRTGSTTTSSTGTTPSTPSGAAPRWPAGTGSRCHPGATVELRLRLRPSTGQARPADEPLGTAYDAVASLAAAGGRRVLRRADTPGHRGRRRHGDAPGLRRSAVEQAALRVRRRQVVGG